MKLNLKTVIIASIMFLIFLFISIPDILKRSKNLIPSYNFSLSAVSDTSDGGNSSVTNLQDKDDKISLDYQLDNGFAFPYAGFRLQTLGDYSFITKKYDSLKLTVQSDSACALMVNLITDLSIFDTRGGHFRRLTVYFSVVKKIEEGDNSIDIELSDFQIPEWWFTKNRVNRDNTKNLRPISFEAIEVLVNANDQTQQGMIQIETISLEKHLSQLLIANFLKICGIAIILIIISYFFRLKNIMRKAKKAVLNHKTIELDNEKERIKKNIITYLDQNYSDPELNISYMSKKTNISVYLIPTLLKGISDCTFKQYVNNLRVAQAKDLLKDENTKIIDIAYSVGYNTVTHFNKIFKSLVGISPKEYRNKHRSNDQQMFKK